MGRRLQPGRLELRRCRCGVEVYVGLDPLDPDDRRVLGVDHAFVSAEAEAVARIAGRQSYELHVDHAGHSWLAWRPREAVLRRLTGADDRPVLVALDHICGGAA
jgi:hypothetical protein